ncbi:MAG: SAM-dependent methyltransferase [Chloroflexota bacterium]|nr:SAM-dependent methyltransferase [Chloroflexota bacterium]MDE2958714.1 SAM-dependent methyltransferase [Chloroflexota bacterium]
MKSAVEQEIRSLIRRDGRITFARFMEACLYSPQGGFYSTRSDRVSAHFGTSATIHPVFGALIARQLEQMWQLLGEPPVFHVVEVGSGDGSLAHSITDACRRMDPKFARALYYVGADYEPGLVQSPAGGFDPSGSMREAIYPSRSGTIPGIQRVRGAGLGAFRNIVGCILCNELIDNFPVHRFAIEDGRAREIFVTTSGESFVEVLGEPSSPRIESRLAGLGLSPPEGYRGEINLAMEEWISQVCGALDRGFVLTIDYGELADELYSPENAQGTVVCFNRHAISGDPYQDVGQQDITCQVDFTSLMDLGERYGLDTVGYARQRQFLANLGFHEFLDALETPGLSAARAELSRMAMMTLVDPNEYGDFKVLAQAKGMGSGVELLGFQGDGSETPP